MAATAVGASAALAATGRRIFRTRDVEGLYANPSAELARLVRGGALRRPANGYYVLPPPHRLGDPEWRAEIEALALGIAAADHGLERVALCGPSAARLLGAWPRALAVATVAVPSRRRPLLTAWGDIVFLTRDTARLDLTRVRTELGAGCATSPEQTLLDLAARPGVGGLTVESVSEALVALADRVDWQATARLARAQRARAAYARARWVAAPIIDAHAPMPPGGHLVPAAGLRPPADVDPSPFSIGLSP